MCRHEYLTWHKKDMSVDMSIDISILLGTKRTWRNTCPPWHRQDTQDYYEDRTWNTRHGIKQDTGHASKTNTRTGHRSLDMS